MEERATVTHEQWTARAVQLFGPDPMKWAFVCPACGHIATVQDWKDAGATDTQAAFSCVGRHSAKPRKAFGETGPGPCDYAGGGLFGLNPVPVIAPDGTLVRLFAFAEPSGDAKPGEGKGGG